MSPDLEESGEWGFRGSLQEESAEAATGQASITISMLRLAGVSEECEVVGGGLWAGPGRQKVQWNLFGGLRSFQDRPVPLGCGLVPRRWRVPGGLGDSPEAAKPGRVGPRRELEAANVPRRRLSRQ